MWEIDLLRTVALVAMAAYHVVYDIDLLAPAAGPDPFRGFWGALPPVIASSFLALAGLSSAISHRRAAAATSSQRRQRYLRRAGMLAGAALLVSGATLVAVPDRPVRFGILHLVLAGALLAPALHRISSAALVFLAAMLVAGSDAVTHLPGSWALLAFGAPPDGVRAVDYWPVIPWLAPFLVGIVIGRLAYPQGRSPWLARRMRRLPQPPTWLSGPGRSSLTFYLVHQPVILAVMLVALLVAGSTPAWP